MPSLDLETLIQTLQDSHSELSARHVAFSALVAAFQDMACGYALARLGEWHLAQDAAQQAFIVAYQQINQLREPAAFASWLKRIIASQCRQLASGHQESGLALEDDERWPSPEPGPEAIMTANALQHDVLQTVRALPTHEREAVMLYYIDGYSQQEVATFLDIGAPAIRKRLQRARNHLRDAMIDLLRDSLEERRPSKSEAFLRAVQLATTLEEAALEAQLAVLEAALVDGVEINDTGPSGLTLLHWAAQRGNLDAAALLLRYGANPTLVDRQGRTPQRVAVDAGHHDLAALLGHAERRWSTNMPEER